MSKTIELYPLIAHLKSTTDIEVFERDTWTFKLRSSALDYFGSLSRETLERFRKYGDFHVPDGPTEEQVSSLVRNNLLWGLGWPDHHLAVIDAPSLEALVNSERISSDDIALWLCSNATGNQIRSLVGIEQAIQTDDWLEVLESKIIWQLMDRYTSLESIASAWKVVSPQGDKTADDDARWSYFREISRSKDLMGSYCSD